MQGASLVKNLLLNYIVGGEVELWSQGQAGTGCGYKRLDKLHGKAAQDSHTQGFEAELGSIYLIGDRLGGEVDLVYRRIFAQHIQ